MEKDEMPAQRQEELIQPSAPVSEQPARAGAVSKAATVLSSGGGIFDLPPAELIELAHLIGNDALLRLASGSAAAVLMSGAVPVFAGDECGVNNIHTSPPPLRICSPLPRVPLCRPSYLTQLRPHQG